MVPQFNWKHFFFLTNKIMAHLLIDGIIDLIFKIVSEELSCGREMRPPFSMTSRRKNWEQMPEAMGSHQGGDKRSCPKKEQVTSNLQAQDGTALRF